jgi:hypothetical protein
VGGAAGTHLRGIAPDLPHLRDGNAIVAFITEASTVRRILNHIGEPATPPPIARVPGPPSWEEEDSGAVFRNEERFAGGPWAQPEPENERDQPIYPGERNLKVCTVSCCLFRVTRSFPLPKKRFAEPPSLCMPFRKALTPPERRDIY